MARQGERSRLVQNAIICIQGNALTDAELALQLESLWKSGYQAGRSGRLRALAQKGVAHVRRARLSIRIDNSKGKVTTPET